MTDNVGCAGRCSTQTLGQSTRLCVCVSIFPCIYLYNVHTSVCFSVFRCTTECFSVLCVPAFLCSSIWVSFCRTGKIAVSCPFQLRQQLYTSPPSASKSQFRTSVAWSFASLFLWFAPVAQPQKRCQKKIVFWDTLTWSSLYKLRRPQTSDVIYLCQQQCRERKKGANCC